MSGRGGPLVHGGKQFWRCGIVPAGKEPVLAIIDQVIKDFADDLGGEEEISSGQKILLHNLRKVLTFQLLVDEHLARTGVIDQKGNIAPALTGFYLSVMNETRRLIDKLGLKRTRGTETWTRYLASRERALAQTGKRSTGKARAKEIVALEGKE